MSDLRTRETLLLRIKDGGDGDAWEDFVEIYTPLIFGFGRKQGLGEADASDLTQEVMRSVFRSIQSFEYDPNKGSFRSWLYTVARRRYCDLIAKQSRRPLARGGDTGQMMIQEHPDPKEAHDWELDYKRQMFLWATGKIRGNFTDNAWKAFWATAVEERDPEQVGAELEMSRGAVYAAKARVIGALRECVQSVAGEWDLDVV